eukprot:8346569-Pyramimonas_sp.AAC.1
MRVDTGLPLAVYGHKCPRGFMMHAPHSTACTYPQLVRTCPHPCCTSAPPRPTPPPAPKRPLCIKPRSRLSARHR